MNKVMVIGHGLQLCYSCVTVVLQLCYSLLQLCYSCVTPVSVGGK